MNEELNIIKFMREMEQMIKKNALNLKRLNEILHHLHEINIDLACLQRTKVGICINNIRKTFKNNAHIATSTAELIKKWKKIAKEEFSHQSHEHLDNSNKNNRSPNNMSNSMSESRPVGKRSMSPSISDPGMAGVESMAPKRQRRKSGDFNFDDPTFLDVTHQQISSLQAEARKKIKREQQYESSLTDSRRKSVELLREALTFEPNDKNSARLAMEIEACIHKDCASDDKHYKTKIRSRVMNLRDKNNPDLLKNVILGAIKPKTFARMRVEEMASEQLKAARRSIEEESFLERQAKDPTVGLARSEIFSCPECEEKDAFFDISQERVEGGYEPVEVTLLYCAKCGHSWKIV